MARRQHRDLPEPATVERSSPGPTAGGRSCSARLSRLLNSRRAAAQRGAGRYTIFGDSDGPDERSLQTRDHAMASSRMGYI